MIFILGGTQDGEVSCVSFDFNIGAILLVLVKEILIFELCARNEERNSSSVVLYVDRTSMGVYEPAS